MKLHTSLVVASMGIGLLTAGCLGQGDDVGEIGELGLEAQNLGDPEEAGSQNGLLPSDYHASDDLLYQAAFARIFDSAGIVQPILQTLLNSNSDSGRNTFHYAAKCALNAPVVYNGIVYTGNGLLNTTAGWPNSALSVEAQMDMFACIAAHLNPFGVSVPLKLEGLAINPPMSGPLQDSASYSFEEALWGATAGQGAGPAAIIHVWPLSGIMGTCQSPSTAMLTRACGQGATAETCAVVINTDLSGCTMVPGSNFYGYCNGIKVIKTWLKPDDVSTVYGSSCAPIRGRYR